MREDWDGRNIWCHEPPPTTDGGEEDTYLFFWINEISEQLALFYTYCPIIMK